MTIFHNVKQTLGIFFMNKTENLNPQQKLISGEIACHIVGFGRTKLNELVKAKKFPQPIRFSQNFVRWDLDEVNQWIEEQKAARA